MVLTSILTETQYISSRGQNNNLSYTDYLLNVIKEKVEHEKSLIKHEQELEHLANYNRITNLPNNLFFDVYLKKSLAQAIRSQQTMGLLLISLDKFEDFKKAYGSIMSDEFLKIIAKRLQDRVREGDLVAHLDGDKFAIILEDLSQEVDIATVTLNITKTIAKTATLSDILKISLNASIGLVIAPKDAKNDRKLVEYAEFALQQAQNEGSGLFKFYTDEMTKQIMQKTAYEQALKNALLHNELELYYQPLVDLQSNKIVAAEALIRWNYPAQGLIYPQLFIPIAEDTGLINKIGQWVIEEACKQGSKWQEAGYELNISVNISANQFKFQNISTIINTALKKSQFDSSRFKLDLTEQALMQKEEDVKKIFSQLSDDKIDISVDKFGTGYSSLEYLSKHPINLIKIDKKFIDNLPDDKHNVDIVHAIIEMGQALGYKVSALGVEKTVQLEFLQESGCDLYQGYFFSKPLPVDEFEILLKENNS